MKALELTENQKRITEEIQKLHKRGEPLNISAVKDRYPHLLAAVYKIKPFWGWKQAMESAGIDYSAIKVYLKEYVICRLCGEALINMISHLTIRHHITLDEYIMDFPGAECTSESFRSRYFGRTITGRKSNVLLPHWERLWSPEYVLDRIAEFHRKNIQINHGFILENEPSLASAARRCLGGWDNAIRKVGLNPDDIRLLIPMYSWNRDIVLQYLQKRKELGLPMNSYAVSKDDIRLPPAASRYFGSYDNALRAIGLKPGKVKRIRKSIFRTREQVIMAIKKRWQQKMPLNANEMKFKRKNSLLYQGAIRLFGGWRAAIEASGFSYKDVRISRWRSSS